MAIDVAADTQPSNWIRSYPPLVLLAVAVLIAALVLPSSLNLPQSNPSTVLEYAPVPPEDDNPPPDDGSMSTLGLGSSSSLLAGGEPPPPPPPPPPPDEGAGSRPQQKRCIGNRQTEDPMSPTCVPFFDGDNFGATYQGVTGEEIKIIIYLDVGCPNHECSKRTGTFEDLDEEPKPPCPKTWPAGNPDQQNCDYIWIRISRAFNRYFNDRFQTYNRRVKYYAYYTNASSEPQRRKDAHELWAEHEPFAVIDYATYNGYNQAFVDTLAARGVLVFTSRTALPNSFFLKNQPYSWGFYPDVERWSDLYGSYVCQEVAPFRVRRFGSGQGAPNGDPRRFGFFYTTDQHQPGLRLFRDLVKEKLEGCGVEPAAEGTYRYSGFLVKGGDSGADQREAIARFQDAGVTTVLYMGGIEGRFSHEAAAADYYPEIVVAGDLMNDNNETARGQNREVWKNAWGTHFPLRIDRPEAAPAYQAYRESHPHANSDEARFAIEMYRDHFMLFQAIQVAGPRLNPGTVEQGFHALPPHESESPYVSSCFFARNDYSCVKDVAEVWWDPNGRSDGVPTPGCFRMVNGGSRHQAWRWRGADEAFRDPADPCTAFESRYQINPG